MSWKRDCERVFWRKKLEAAHRIKEHGMRFPMWSISATLQGTWQVYDTGTFMFSFSNVRLPKLPGKYNVLEPLKLRVLSPRAHELELVLAKAHTE